MRSLQQVVSFVMIFSLLAPGPALALRPQEQAESAPQELAAGLRPVVRPPSAEAAGLEEPLKVHIDWLIRRDYPEVLQIEQASFPAPWTEEDLLRFLRRRDTIGMVAENPTAAVGEKRIYGFLIYTLEKRVFSVWCG
ncbi:MAG: hypothetical protein HYZ93_00660 [Candidatus Omnitrophica bacterium]|nr:hypothetical protein [Candidatus Omnitrophota bacterium]